MRHQHTASDRPGSCAHESNVVLSKCSLEARGLRPKATQRRADQSQRRAEQGIDTPFFPKPAYFRETFVNPSPRVDLRPPVRIGDFVVDGKLELSLRSYLELVMANNTDVNIQKVTLEFQKHAITRAFARFDPTLVASFSSERTKSPATDVLAGATTASGAVLQSYEGLAFNSLNSNIASLDSQVESLKTSQANMRQKIELFQARKEELKALYDSSRAQLQVKEAASGISKDLADVGHAIQRAETRIQAMQARVEAIEARGGNSFAEFSLPEAILKFRQGVGRLIRTGSDSGIIVVLDNRILNKRCGKAWLDATPK